jgi:hypothetical protein
MAVARWALLAALHVAVAVVFLRGFLLTRLELPDVSACHPLSHSCGASQPPPYSKLVLLIADAVRHDFLCGSSAGSAYSAAGMFNDSSTAAGGSGVPSLMPRRCNSCAAR